VGGATGGDGVPFPGMRFTKAHGTGNDFVVLADPEDRLDLTAGLVRALCDRRTGIGADGVLRLGAPDGDADVFMDYRNADGSVVEMCGNGVRVTAKHAVDHGLVAARDDVVRVGTRAGVKPVEVVRGDHGLVVAASVDMGPPILDPAEVPFETAEDAPSHEVDVDGERVRLGVASMGNPHAVVPVDDVATAPVTTLGPRLETHPRFPAKVNAGFAQVLSSDAIRLRVWERGVGETQACGTGACAAVVVLQRLGRLDDRVDVHLPGGTLVVHHADGGTVEMTGPAVEVAHGDLDVAWLAAVHQQGARP
jgi:diaminopimelate epimerase